MARALKLLLSVCLLHGALCGRFEAVMPKTINVMSGSCVTIPCSFDIQNKYNINLDNTCNAIWKINQKTDMFDSSTPQLSQIKGNLTGNLQSRDCSTTLNNMQPAHSNDYWFRLECANKLKWTYENRQLSINVTADPPTPTVTPSSLNEKEGNSVRLTCSAPAPCLSQPPTLTWTPSLGDSQETLQENEDKTKVMTSVLTFTASHLHHGKKISCTATYNKQDGSTKPAVSRSVTAKISYSPKNITVSVSPSGPVPEDTIVTLTCSSDANPAATIYTWHRADGGQDTFMGNGAKLNLKASEVSDPFFCKAENNLGPGRSNITQIDVQFAPKILPSSDCAKPAGQINCYCETVGNPSPKLRWYLNGNPVNQSDTITIRNMSANGTVLRSIITLTHPPEKNLPILVCHSTNTLGSASHTFCVHRAGQSQGHIQGLSMLPVFITTVVALLALVCALLFVIRARNTRHDLQNSQCKGDTSTVAMRQLITSGEENEVSNTVEEDIYANASVLKEENTVISETNSTNLPCSETETAEGDDKSSEKKEHGSDVIYSSVKWKSKTKKGKDSGDMDQPGRSYLEEEQCMVRDMPRNFVSNAVQMGSIYDEVESKTVRKEAECDYAQVKFKEKKDMNK